MNYSLVQTGKGVLLENGHCMAHGMYTVKSVMRQCVNTVRRSEIVFFFFLVAYAIGLS